MTDFSDYSINTIHTFKTMMRMNMKHINLIFYIYLFKTYILILIHSINFDNPLFFLDLLIILNKVLCKNIRNKFLCFIAYS